MSIAPPGFLVTIMNRIIPPASREAVLGDLWEEYRSPAQFVKQGLTVLPFLMLSQLRRRSSWPILGLQAFILFACLRGFLSTETMPPPWMRASLPTLFTFLALAWHDTYRAWQDERVARPAYGEIAAVMVGIGLSQLMTAVIVAATGLSNEWLLTWAELLFAASALPVLCLLRWGSAWAKINQESHNVDLFDDYERFRSSVRWRNRLEIGAMAVTLLISSALLFRAEGPVPLVVWSTLFGFLCLLAYLVRSGRAPTPLPAASGEEIRRLFCKELVRQHKLRSTLVWWWLTPLLIGLVMHFLLATNAGPLLARQIVGVLLILALGACIWGFNAERGEMVRGKIKSLQSIAGSLDGRLC
jgi:hypothetical protein